MNKKFSTYDTLIIGGGPAGLTSAIYCARAGLNTALLEKSFCGGQISFSNKIENFPGLYGISGTDFSENLQNQVENLGCKIFYKEVIDIEISRESFDKPLLFVLKTGSEEFIGRSVIIANGLKRRKLGCPGEEEFIGKGVSYCATCDGMFYKNKIVAVVGGGDTAAEDALYLSKICKKTIMIIRKPNLACQNLFKAKLKNTENIDIKFNSKLEKICGESGKVKSIFVKNLIDESIEDIELSGVFLAIGYESSNKIFKKIAKIDKYGYFESDENCVTKTDGVFCAGDTRKKSLRQLVTAVADGANAANSAIKFLQLNIK